MKFQLYPIRTLLRSLLKIFRGHKIECKKKGPQAFIGTRIIMEEFKIQQVKECCFKNVIKSFCLQGLDD